MILIAYGTRPEIIKLFPVINELKRRKVPFKTLFSGQQYDLYRDVCGLIPPPDFSFEHEFTGRKKHNTLGMSYVKICEASEKLFSRGIADRVIVQGDTTTALAIAQMAFYNGMAVAHVEAGLRTFDLQNPYPEELNRVLISRFADLNFAPTRQACDNLKREGVRNIHFTGNTIVDAVNYFKGRLKLTDKYEDLVLVTLHRRENHPIMHLLFDELQKIAVENPGLNFIFPIHPNPNVGRHRQRLRAENIRVIEPLGYPDMLKLLSRALFIITDSGGIQEEATCLNKKVLIMRKVTERPETVESGLGILAGRHIRKYVKWAATRPERLARSPYGKGNSAQKIVDILLRKGIQE